MIRSRGVSVIAKGTVREEQTSAHGDGNGPFRADCWCEGDHGARWSASGSRLVRVRRVYFARAIFFKMAQTRSYMK